MSSADIQKIYVKQDGTAVVRCPGCGKPRTLNAAKLNRRGGPFPVRCSCRAVFRVFFEFRGAYRKKTNLEGDYNQLPDSKQLGRMRIENISMSGIGFRTLNRHNLKKGDGVRVKFTLDDAKNSEIEKDTIISWVKGNCIGCEFVDTDQYDKVLGFYLMP